MHTAAFAVLMVLVGGGVLLLLKIFGSPKHTKRYVYATVAIGWFFSFCVVVLMPTDVSSTIFLRSHPNTSEEGNSDSPLSSDAFLGLWIAVYWITFLLTWAVIPIMQSFVMAGDFTFKAKIKTAFRENLIFYGIVGALFIGFVIYVGVVRKLTAQGLIGFAIATSNVWGLLILTLTLGYGLVEVPKRIWNSADVEMSLRQCEFRATILAEAVDEAKGDVLDAVDTVKCIDRRVSFHDEMRPFVEIILEEIPVKYRNDDQVDNDEMNDVSITLKLLASLRRRLKNTVWSADVSERQYDLLLHKAFKLRDIVDARQNFDREIRLTFPPEGLSRPVWIRTFEWWWEIRLKPPLKKALSVFLSILSAVIVWCEVTMFIYTDHVDLSVWSAIVHAPGAPTMMIEIMIFIGIMYLCVCAYFGLFRLRLFNYYRLQANQHSDDNSLLFAAAYSCRLAAPICYNLLNILHEVSDTEKIKTAFLRVMGSMDVVPFFGDEFNIYFPILILILCVITFFNLYSRILTTFGVSRFRFEVDFRHELVDQGRELIDKEKEKLQRSRVRQDHARENMKKVDRAREIRKTYEGRFAFADSNDGKAEMTESAIEIDTLGSIEEDERRELFDFNTPVKPVNY